MPGPTQYDDEFPPPRVVDKRGKRDLTGPLPEEAKPLTPEEEQRLIAQQIKAQESTPFSGGGIKAPQEPAPQSAEGDAESTEAPAKEQMPILTAFAIVVLPDGSSKAIPGELFDMTNFAPAYSANPALIKRALHDLLDETFANQIASETIAVQQNMAQQFAAQQATQAALNGHPMAMQPRKRK